MAGRIRALAGALLVPFFSHLSSQNPLPSFDAGEELFYREMDPDDVEEAFVQYEELKNRPLDLNLSNREELAGSGLFTAFQVHQLVRYRERFGELYSVYELAGITGFSEHMVILIEPYITAGHGTLSPGHSRGSATTIMKWETRFPRSSGYGTDKDETSAEPTGYMGSPSRWSLRFKFAPARGPDVGFAFEKDPGEPFMNGPWPQFLSGYFCFNGNRFLRKLVTGTFRIHQGMGLVNGSTGSWGGNGNQVNRISMSRVRPYASTGESGFHRGIAGSLHIHNTSLMFWSSMGRMDLSPSGLELLEQPTALVTMSRQEGLYRTLTEMKARWTGFRGSSGLQFLTGHSDLVAGLLLCTEYCGLTSRGRSLSSMDPGIQWNPILSIHWQWIHGTFDFFGECAMDVQPATAMLGGMAWNPSDFFRFSTTFHKYGRNYRGILPSAFAWGSRPENETGMAFQFHLESATGLLSDLSATLFHFPYPRTGTGLPSLAYRYRWTLDSPVGGTVSWRMRILRKGWQNTPDDQTKGAGSLKSHSVTRFDGSFRLDRDSILSWQSRIVLSGLRIQDGWGTGTAVEQRVVVAIHRSIRSTLQCVMFRVPDWDNRIYLYEPGFYLSYAFPSCYGRGQKFTLVCSWDPSRRFTLSWRVTCTTYQDRKSLGSGNDMTPGNRKWETGIQVRLAI